MKKGLLVVISSPSGGGKDSVINALLKIVPNSSRLITTTTRPMRPGNQDGVDYYFISEEKFKEKIKKDEFVEYNLYSDNYYGSQKKYLNESLIKHDLVFTQMEVNGKHNLDKQSIPHLSIFLLPEDLNNLKERITKRGGLSPEQIKRRLETAKKEVEESKDYDYKVINKEGELKQTIAKIKEIIEKELNG
jgi:guanylate kinase